jgi:hypothetical protein
MRGGSPLQRLVAQLQDEAGGTRSAGAPADEPFLVVHRSWVLHPLRAPVALAAFAGDDDPTETRGVGAKEAWLGGGGISRPLAIRLRDIAADGPRRLDALVCTRSADRSRAWEARTFRIGGTEPAGPLELWRGTARDLIEIFVWVGLDPGGELGARPELAALAALLAPELERAEIREALDALVVTDERAPWALAAGACAALANAAWARLPGAAGLAHLAFPLADPPRHLARYRGPGVELDLEIADAVARAPAPP